MYVIDAQTDKVKRIADVGRYPWGISILAVGQPELLPLDAEPACLRSCALHGRTVRSWVPLTFLGVLAGGCAPPPAHDPGKAELLRQIREAYLFDVDVGGLELLSVPEIVARLDPDTRLVEARRRMSLDFLRGFEPEGSVTSLRDVGRRSWLHPAGFLRAPDAGGHA